MGIWTRLFRVVQPPSPDPEPADKTAEGTSDPFEDRWAPPQLEDEPVPSPAPSRTQVPLWHVGETRPVRKERRRDPGAWHRHEQARTGAPPVEAVKQRRGEKPASDRVVNVLERLERRKKPRD